MAHGGHCVARHEGRVVFVRHALPGEVVLARVTDGAATSSFWRADAVEIERPSPDRVTPPCPLSGPGRCGGCDWQHAALPAQRALKADVVAEQLRRLAGLEPGLAGVPEVVVEPVEVPASRSEGDVAPGLGWRTRMRYTVDSRGRAGLRRHRSHSVLPVPHCPIADPAGDALGIGSRTWSGAAAVDVVVPSAPEDGGPLVVVEAARGRDRVRLPDLGADVSVAVRDDEGLHRVRGRTWVREEVRVDDEPRSFRVTGTGFWQVHPAAAQTLLDAVLDAASPAPGERTLDLYSGVGLFTVGLADRVGPGGSVVAVESEGRAVRDARRSMHDLPQVRFETGAVAAVLPGLGASGVDVVVLDPPRSGAGRDVVAGVTALAPRVIVYVACDPAALARDVAFAADAGYRLAALRAFDVFPMTHHVECVATLVPVMSALGGAQ